MLPNITDNLIILVVCSTKQLASFDVLNLRLLSFDARESVTVACVETGLLPIPFQTNRVRIDAV